MNTINIDNIVQKMILEESRNVLTVKEYTLLEANMSNKYINEKLEEGIIDTVKDKVSKVIFNKVFLKVDEYSSEIADLRTKLDDENIDPIERKRIENVILAFINLKEQSKKAGSLTTFVKVIVELFKIGLIIAIGIMLLVFSKSEYAQQNPIYQKVLTTISATVRKLESVVRNTSIESISSNSMAITGLLRDTLASTTTYTGMQKHNDIPGIVDQKFIYDGKGKIDYRTQPTSVTAYDNTTSEKVLGATGIFILGVQVIRSIKSIVSNIRNKDAAKDALTEFEKEMNKFKKIK